MKNKLGGWLAFALLLCSAVARAEVTLNLKDADISTLIQTVSEVTGKNFIVDPRVKGKVTVISASPMDEDGLYETFLAVLQVQGFAAIPAGDTIKIVPETNARQDGGGTSDYGYGVAIDEVVTHVYPIQNVSAAQLVPILRPLVPQWGHLAAYAPSNMLIISDRAANVGRLERLIRQIDQSGDRGIELVKLQHASAAEVVRVLTSLAQGDKQAQADATQRPVAVIADERSNSVLIGGDKAERQKLLDIIVQLDVPVGEDGATQVVYLKYASAENLSPILEGYAQQVSQPPAATGAAAATSAPATSSGPNANGVRVLADKDTNALIITAPPKTMRQVRDVIAQLDIRRAQVLVEGIIAEVSASKSSALGIDWAVFNGDRIAAAGLLDPASLAAVQGLGAVTGSGSSSSNTDLAALGLLGNGINIAGGRDGGDNGTSFAILLKAIKGDGDSNVLSTPTLVTLDNEEAEISVGQEVPFLTGSFSNTGATGGSTLNPFQTIERKDVGLTLGITPQVNEGNNIKLKLKLEVSSLVTGSTGGAVDLVTNKRTLTNTVSVEDGQVLVLGGLIDDNLNDTQRGVPFLSEIPLIGSLFRFRSVANNKRNLMVFIKPAILRKQSEGDYYSRLKYDSVRNQQLATTTGGAVPLIGGKRIVLDAYDAYAARDAEFRAQAQAAAAAEAAATRAADAPGAAGSEAPASPQAIAPTEPAAAEPAPEAEAPALEMAPAQP